MHICYTGLRVIYMSDILSKIQQADDNEINEIIDAITQRYSEVYPDWEIMFLALPRHDPDACLRKLEQISNFIKRHYN